MTEQNNISPNELFKAVLTIGSLPNVQALQAAQKVALGEVNFNPFEEFVSGRTAVNFSQELARFIVDTNFVHKDEGLSLKKDIIGLLKRLPGGAIETYDKKLAREMKKGSLSAATYGIASINHHEFVFFASRYNFHVGTLGLVVGEKYNRAVELAIKKRSPLIAWLSSGGVVQQENFPGLLQMASAVSATQKFKEKITKPLVAVLADQVWGGVSASIVPLADIRVALEGTDFGFSGRRVISTFTGIEVPEGAQSTEFHLTQRNVDVMLKPNNLKAYLGNLLDVSDVDKKKQYFIFNNTSLPRAEKFASARFSLSRSGFSSVSNVKSDLKAESEELFKTTQKDRNDLYQRYEYLLMDANRIDSETFIASGLEDPTPLYSSFVSGDRYWYPAIIAALGKINGKGVVLIGNQPSYHKQDKDRVVKRSSSPTPADYAYMQRVMSMGERLHFPLICLIDTPGASPTLKEEFAGQSDAIANTILKGLSYKYPIISIVMGILGSGGGLASMPIGDRIVGLENSLFCIAEPRSSSAILYGKDNPEKDEVVLTLSTMKATAKDQIEIGNSHKILLIDEIIQETAEPGITESQSIINKMVNYISKELLILDEIKSTKRLEARRKRLREISRQLTKDPL